MWLRRKSLKKIKQHFYFPTFQFLTNSHSLTKARWKRALEVFVLLLLILVLARPQTEGEEQREVQEGLEMVIIADVSPSMLAEDVRPSRFEQMKIGLRRLLELRRGDKVGLVALSGSSILLSPLTTDQTALRMYIDSLATNTVSSQGTDFKEALDKALSALKRGGTSEDDSQSGAEKIILIASDGENHTEGALQKIKEIKDKNIKIFTLAFGTSEGETIPIKDQYGNLLQYKRDREGNVILTKAQFGFMKELAAKGGGKSFIANYGNDSIGDLNEVLKKLDKGEFESRIVKNYEEFFQIPLLLALLLSLIELNLGDRKSPGSIWRGRFERST